MKYRRLGRSHLEVSVIGLGTLAMGGRAYGPIDDEASIATIRRAMELGINLIDTSDNYGRGHAEEVVGRAIKGHRDDVIIATKGGTPWDEEGRVTFDCGREAITRAVEDSLRRLDTDWIDLYQIHVPDPETPYEETAHALERLIQAGKIRYAGLSNFWAEDLRAWLAIGGIVSDQMPYNLLHRDVEGAFLSLCREHGVGVIAYTPLLMGMFAGSATPETTFGDGDHRSSYPQFQGKPLRDCLALRERLQPMAAELGMTLAQLALSWVISRLGVTCAIPGAKRPEQVEENAVAGEHLLSEADLARIDELLEETEVETPRLIPMRVVDVREGADGRIAVLAMGAKVRLPDGVGAGDVVQMDAVTGRIAESPPDVGD
jgi:aryl-alcohol dehydrogenase-like predicted oxidoreductase